MLFQFRPKQLSQTKLHSRYVPNNKSIGGIPFSTSKSWESSKSKQIASSTQAFPHCSHWRTGSSIFWYSHRSRLKFRINSICVVVILRPFQSKRTQFNLGNLSTTQAPVAP